MEGGLAEELYGKISLVAKSDPDSTSAANGFDEGALHTEDGSLWDGSDEELDKASDLDREWQKRRDQFHTIGYRDGIIAGKEVAAQEGFNIGFNQSVLVGYNWGLVRGVTSALALLPDGLREKLIETREKRNKFRGLYEYVSSLSTADALKLFHDDIMTNKTTGQSEDAEAILDVAGLQERSSDCSHLENYVRELQSFFDESSAVQVQFAVDKQLVP